MKRLGGLWPQITAYENLLNAYYNARKGKLNRQAVAAFGLNLEKELFILQHTLSNGTYRPGAYRQFTIYDRKPRLISAAPFRDRVVHHAVMDILEPQLDRRFIDDSYACRKDKGVHAAVDRYQQFARRYAYVMKLDIQRYFPSIDHQALKMMLRRRIKDDRLLQLLDLIIDCGGCPSRSHTGIPIGNLTSQFFANLYLDDLDHWLKEQCRIKGYLRYVDDLFLLADDKQCLWQLQRSIAAQLALIQLRLHPQKIQVFRSHEKIDVLGYQVSPHRRWLRNDNGYRFQRKFKRMAKSYQSGRLNYPQIKPRIRSWIGHAQHAETYGLRKRIFSCVIFTREQARQSAPRASGRLLEQQTEEPALGEPEQEHRDQPEQQ